MTYPFYFNLYAYEEYIEAFEWYDERQKGLGERFMHKVEEKLIQISHHPEYFGKRKSNYREAKVENFPFMIVFEFFKRRQIIHIAAIYHSKRSPRKKYRRMK